MNDLLFACGAALVIGAYELRCWWLRRELRRVQDIAGENILARRLLEVQAGYPQSISEAVDGYTHVVGFGLDSRTIVMSWPADRARTQNERVNPDELVLPFLDDKTDIRH